MSIIDDPLLAAAEKKTETEKVDVYYILLNLID